MICLFRNAGSPPRTPSRREATRPTSLRVGVASVLVVLLMSSRAWAGSSVLLNSGLADDQQLRDFVVSPDGSHVAFSTVTPNSVYTIYSSAIDGTGTTAVTTINTIMVPYLNLSRDGGVVVFGISYFDMGNKTDLYSVSATGGTPVKLNDGYNESLRNIAIAPDDSRIVFSGEPLGGTRQVISAPLRGDGSLAQLSEPLVSGGEVNSLAPVLISQDSRVVLYGNYQTTGVNRYMALCMRALDGSGSQVNLNPAGTHMSYTSIYPYPVITPDGSRAVFYGYGSAAGSSGLYSVPLDGTSIATNISQPGLTGYSYLFSPNSSHVVYIANGDKNVYSVPVAGGVHMKLSNNANPNAYTYTPRIAPDSSRVVYVADHDTDNVMELYSVPLTGGTVVKLNDTLPAFGDVQLSGLIITPDSSRVVFRADMVVDEAFEIFSVSILGGDVVRLSSPLSEPGVGEPGSRILLTPDGEFVVFEQDIGGNRLWAAPIAGGSLIPLSPIGVFDRVVVTDSGVVFTMRDEATQTYDLFATSIPEPGTVVLLGVMLAAMGRARSR